MTKRKQIELQDIRNLMALCPGSVLVGGSVRSLALRLPLSNDVDLLVASSKLTVEQYCAVHNLEVLKIVPEYSGLAGAGTAKCYSGGFVFDVTVTSQQIRANMLSRDFSVNAMWLTAEKLSSGQWHKPACVVGGLSACAKRTLAAPEGDDLAMLLYDPCRIVRAMRLRLQLTEACDAEWSYGPGLKRTLKQHESELCTALLAMLRDEKQRAKLRNDMTKLFACAESYEVFDELRTALPSGLANTLLRAAGGKLALKGVG